MNGTIKASISKIPISSAREHSLSRQKDGLERIEKAYRRNKLDFFKYLYYRTGDWQQAEKFTIEIQQRMRRAFPVYQQNKPPYLWLMQIARNMAIEYQQHKNLLDENQTDEQAEQEIKAPLNRAPLDREEDDILWALRQMDGLCQDVVIMRFLVGLPLREVATTLNKTTDTVRYIQQQSLKVMQKLISVE